MKFVKNKNMVCPIFLFICCRINCSCFFREIIKFKLNKKWITDFFKYITRSRNWIWI